MSVGRERCPTCGSAVVVHAGGEGTSHYVPANDRETSETIIALRAALEDAGRALNRAGRIAESQAALDALKRP